jgi:hypothetical protein
MKLTAAPMSMILPNVAPIIIASNELLVTGLWAAGLGAVEVVDWDPGALVVTNVDDVASENCVGPDVV